jgi:hypothetical protein
MLRFGDTVLMLWIASKWLVCDWRWRDEAHSSESEQITSQQSVLERKKHAFEEAEAKTIATEADVTAEQAAIAKEISVADPYVKNAKDALHGIGLKDLQVLKGMKSPSVPVR